MVISIKCRCPHFKDVDAPESLFFARSPRGTVVLNFGWILTQVVGCVVTAGANLRAAMMWFLGDNALGLWASAIHG